jgi:hypothetical protein
MLDHLGFVVTDLTKAHRFCDAVLRLPPNTVRTHCASVRSIEII